MSRIFKWLKERGSKKTILEDAIERFGKDRVDRWVAMAGHHARVFNPRVRIGETREERLIFALLEILDFECYKFKDAPCYPGVPKEQIEQFLLDHKKEVMKAKIDPPSILGLLAGAYDFLFDEKNPPALLKFLIELFYSALEKQRRYPIRGGYNER